MFPHDISRYLPYHLYKIPTNLSTISVSYRLSHVKVYVLRNPVYQYSYEVVITGEVTPILLWSGNVPCFACTALLAWFYFRMRFSWNITKF